MSESRIVIRMGVDDIMDCLSESARLQFAYECYNYLGVSQQQKFIENLGAEEIVEYLDEEIVEYLDDKAMIKELEGRGYKITQNGGEDI